ncbi:hypothetical protein P5673_014859, partial [Acropora cervicornis]
MWHDSFNNGEPSQLPQFSDTSFQRFGGLSENLSQDDFDPFMEQNIQGIGDNSAPRFQAKAWYDMGSLFMEELPESSNETGSHVLTGGGNAQSPQGNSTSTWLTSQTVSCQDDSQRKSAVLNKIHHLKSTSFALDEEIEEQKHRNIILEKQIADGDEHLTQMNEQAMSLKSELQEMTEKHRKFENTLDCRIQQLTAVIETKRRNIYQIKHDANMVETLREDKNKVRVEIKKLEEQLEDINLDIYWMDYRFMHDLDRMVIFPFWKLEEDLERALNGEDPTLYDEPGPPDSEDDEGDGYDYDEDEIDDYEEEASTEDKETYKSSERTSDCTSSLRSSNATASESCHSTEKNKEVKSGSKFGKFLANVFRDRSAGKMNQQK